MEDKKHLINKKIGIIILIIGILIFFSVWIVTPFIEKLYEFLVLVMVFSIFLIFVGMMPFFGNKDEKGN